MYSLSLSDDHVTGTLILDSQENNDRFQLMPWVTNPEPAKKLLHNKFDAWPTMSKGNMDAFLVSDEGKQINRAHMMLFAAQYKQRSVNSSPGFVYCLRSVDDYLMNLNNGYHIFLHEVLVEGAATKIFFDIDGKGSPLSPEEVEKVCIALFEEGAKCGWSRDMNDWYFLQSPHPNKCSLRVIVCGSHYESRAHQLEHMRFCKFNFECVKPLQIDLNVYKPGTHNLRGLGASWWNEERPYPFHMLGVSNDEITMQMLRDCLVQYVSPESRKIIYEVPALVTRKRPTDDIRLGDPRLKAALDYLNNFVACRTKDIQVSALSVLNYSQIRFTVEGHTFCDHPFIIIYNHRLDVMSRRCSQDCCDEAFEGTTIATKSFIAQRKFLRDFLIPHGLDRFDWPLVAQSNDQTKFSIGRRGQTRETFFADLKAHFKKSKFSCRCDWCSDPDVIVPSTFQSFFIDPNERRAFSRKFFTFLVEFHNPNCRDITGKLKEDYIIDYDLLIGYMNLFVCKAYPLGGKWLIRDRFTYASVSKADVMDFFSDLCVPKLKKKGAGEEVEWYEVQEKIWKSFHDSNTFGHHQINYGTFYLHPGAPLNLSEPLGVDVISCMEKWNWLNLADKKLVQDMWMKYLSMLVLNEPIETREEIIKFLHEWVCSVCFEPLTPTRIMVLLSSLGGGQGKSTLGYIICAIVGSDNCSMTTANNAFGNFGYQPGFNFLDEIVTNKQQAEALKSALTSPVCRIEKKYVQAVTADEMRNWLGTSNKAGNFNFLSTEVERRFLALEIPERTILDEDFASFQRVCDVCTPAEKGWMGVCPHDLGSHSDLMHKFHSDILQEKNKCQFVQGRLFDPFVGLLFLSWQLFKAKDLPPLRARLMVTAATTKFQNLQENIVGQFINDCIGLGRHWHPSLPPAHLNVLSVVRDDDSLLLASVSEELEWRQFVALDEFYNFFVRWCKDGNHKLLNKIEFFSLLNDISLTRRNINLQNTTKEEKGRQYQWKAPFANVEATWMPVTKSSTSIKVLDMGTLDSWKKKTRAVGEQVAGAGLHRSSSAVLQEHSNASSSSYQESEEIQPRTLIRSNNDSTNAFFYQGRRTGIVEHIQRLQESDNANQGFELPFTVRDEEVDEYAQDLVAAASDKRAKENRKRARPFIDASAEEGSEEEEEEDHKCWMCGEFGATKRVTQNNWAHERGGCAD